MGSLEGHAPRPAFVPEPLWSPRPHFSNVFDESCISLYFYSIVILIARRGSLFLPPSLLFSAVVPRPIPSFFPSPFLKLALVLLGSTLYYNSSLKFVLTLS